MIAIKNQKTLFINTALLLKKAGGRKKMVITGVLFA